MNTIDGIIENYKVKKYTQNELDNAVADEREKVLSEVEKWASENEKFWDNSVYVSQLKDKLNQMKARE